VTLLHATGTGQVRRTRYQRFARGRCETTSRAGFQICPHPLHRQYVVSEIDLLVVVTAAD
jgi:hypothetical protein